MTRPDGGPEVPDADRFHNPYGFVPAPDREAGTHPTHPELADVGEHRRPPAEGTSSRAWLAGHDRLWEDRWTGQIAVTLEVATPLVLMDTARYEECAKTKHKTYDVLERVVDGEKRPHLPPTAVKGMLRSAYEAVTNSRFGVFVDHDDRLGYRMPAADGVRSVPARVSDDGMHLELMLGAARLGDQWRPAEKEPGKAKILPAQHAAWLPFYWPADEYVDNIRAMPDGQPLKHGQKVHARLQFVKHGLFGLWWVRAVAASQEELPPAGKEPAVLTEKSGFGLRQRRDRWLDVVGYVCITHRNIEKKLHERLFFRTPDGFGRAPRPIDDELRQRWREVIRSYRGVRRPNGLVYPAEGDILRDDVSSRHLLDDAAEEMKAGDLLYVQLDDTNRRVTALYPVSVSRALYDVPPSELLPESLRPAEELSQLSPADRVFGWVRTSPGVGRTASSAVGASASSSGGGGSTARINAWAGCLRIGPVTCDQKSDPDKGKVGALPAEGGGAVQRFVAETGGKGVPLAILSAPKPSQGRFYVGREQDDGVQPLHGPSGDDGRGRPVAKDDLYSGGDSHTGGDGGQVLRGRKVYRHHANLPARYWDDPWEDRSQRIYRGTWYPEYRRPHQVQDEDRPLDGSKARFGMKALTEDNEQRDEQNRSVLGWVRRRATFSFHVEVRNLSSVELGALLWLLDLGAGADRFHRLGFGKPLGFGSVKLGVVWDKTDVRDGQAWREHFTSLVPTEAAHRSRTASKERLLDTVAEFKRAIAPTEATFEDVDHIRAFLGVAEGDPAVPVHYPRVRPQGMRRDVRVPPDPRGRSYEWFVENERTGNAAPAGAPQALPDLGGPPLAIYSQE